AAWTAAASTQGGSIGDFSTADFAAYYVCLSLVIQITNAWDAYDFEFEVRTGRLAPKLLRPLHPLHYAAMSSIVHKLFTVPMLLPVLIVLAWRFNAHFSTQPWHVVLFVPSVLLAAVLRFTFGWVLASLAFWTTRITSIMEFYDRLLFLFAGTIAPLSLLPGPLATLGYALPFGYMIWAPTEILRGGTTLVPTFQLIGIQLVWLLVSWVAFRIIWHRGVRQFSAVGA
ncbi:MAG: ABC-2 family transporter protein, partial [Chloroflexi bacterium]|nr:ABC-2 family transporter protein [Chloroflexota bacterium]